MSLENPSIANPHAWPVDAVERSGIGPANPYHPHHNVYYDANGQPLPAEVVADNVQRALVEFPGFPDLVKTIVGVESI